MRSSWWIMFVLAWAPLTNLVGISSAVAQNSKFEDTYNGTWFAISSSAMWITGNIVLSPGILTADNGVTIRLAYEKDVQVLQTAKPQQSFGDTFHAFRLLDGDPPVLKSGNTFCGGRARYLLISFSPTRRNMDLWTTALDTLPSELSDKNAICSTFWLERE